MKAIEQYFLVVLFMMLYKVALTLKSLDQKLVRGYPNKVIEQYYNLVQHLRSVKATQAYL